MLRKNSQQVSSGGDEKEPRFILIDRVTRKIWHEQFRSRAEAQGKIDYEKSKGVVGNWVIEQA